MIFNEKSLIFDPCFCIKQQVCEFAPKWPIKLYLGPVLKRLVATGLGLVFPISQNLGNRNRTDHQRAWTTTAVRSFFGLVQFGLRSFCGPRTRLLNTIDDQCNDKCAQLPFVHGLYNACGPAQQFLALMEGLSAQSAPDSRLFVFLDCSLYVAIPHQFGDLMRPSEIAFNNAGADVLTPSAYTQSHRKSWEAMIVGNLPLTPNLQN